MKTDSPINKVKVLAGEASENLKGKTVASVEITTNFFSGVGDMSIFLIKTIRQFFVLPLEFREFLKQCFEVGNKSLPLTAITGAIMGLVLTIQSRPILNDFGAEGMLPEMVAVSLVREIGPVITALICAGKVGSGIGAELGSMKVTEQIDAMEVSATNPIKYLVVTRVLACTFMLPILVLFADTAGMFGSWIGINLKSDLDLVLFFSKAFSSVEFVDFLPAFIKSFIFGSVIGIVGSYKGYTAGRGTESVGIAANTAVVLSSLLIIIVDLIVVQITDLII
jgi:phospholipid/cholesterol/gamma-HCH transport system permease protein